jgi:phosphatidylserine/phosphatidylglycerophosphate/cardiolipin synthase-like enzyme
MITAALTDTAGTRLGLALADGVAAHPGKTGVHPLGKPRDAFATRVLLAAAAERSLDVQSCIWHGDPVGHGTGDRQPLSGAADGRGLRRHRAAGGVRGRARARHRAWAHGPRAASKTLGP